MNKIFTFGNVLLKIAIVGFIALLMLIPISKIEDLITERKTNRDQVVGELGRQWGGPQNIRGPLLVLPYLQSDSTETKYAYFLPETLDVKGEIQPELRSRGIYKELCYQSELQYSGTFKFPDYANLGIKESQVDWGSAFFLVGITHLSSITNKVALKVNDSLLAEPARGFIADLHSTGLSIAYPLQAGEVIKNFSFEFALGTKGMETLYLSPMAKETSVNLKSTWNNVSFGKDFLPNTRDVNEKGFEAQWNIYEYNSFFPSMWTSFSNVQEPYIGVEMITPLDHYQKIMRSVKYALLFIVLTYSVFFLVEILCKSKIHPIQYILVGFALVLFYSLLLSISEYIGFDIAYILSALATVLLITVFTHLLLNRRKPTITIFSFLMLLYIFLYVVLQLEDMALLIGSIGLFVMLATIMMVSAKIDWNLGGSRKQVNKDSEDLSKSDEGNVDKTDTYTEIEVKIDTQSHSDTSDQTPDSLL